MVKSIEEILRVIEKRGFANVDYRITYQCNSCGHELLSFRHEQPNRCPMCADGKIVEKYFK